MPGSEGGLAYSPTIPLGAYAVAENTEASTIELTATIVGAFAGNNKIAVGELPALIREVHAALSGVGQAEAVPAEAVTRATPSQIRKSITPDGLQSFEDGKMYKTLKRHLTTHGMTVAEYKAKWGLPNDYPTTAPAYSEARSAMARALGLGQGGRKPKGAAPAPKATRGKAKA